MARHNKKRNVGLIYELLVRRLSKAVVEDDSPKIQQINQIIANRFRPGTELYKEFRLFNAIASTEGVSEQLAFRILDEAKTASMDHNAKNLDREKSLLIKDINHQLNESDFYDLKIENYPMYASAQQLFNFWRSGSRNISEVVKHEQTVHAWLTQKKDSVQLNEEKTQDINDLTVKIMQEKFEAKYGASLNSDQSSLLRLFCEGNDEKLLAFMNELNTKVNVQARKVKKVMSNDKFLFEKVVRVENIIKEEVSTCDIDEVSKSMAVAQLLSELKEFENVKC